MATNYIKLGNENLIDLRSDTVTADRLLSGYTAHDKSGEVITGTATAVQRGTIAAGTSNPTSWTITGLTGKPTCFMMVSAGWSGNTANNTGRITRIWMIPGSATYSYYGIAAYNNGTIEYHADADGSGGNANKAAVEAAVVFNHSAGTCTLTIPTLYLNSSSSKQCFLRNNYRWIAW